MIKRPKAPSARIIKEGYIGKLCSKCRSSCRVRFFFIVTDKCINPECENYYNQKEIKEKVFCFKCGWFDKKDYCMCKQDYIKFGNFLGKDAIAHDFNCETFVEETEHRILSKDW